MPLVGVYAIRNIITGNCYIGSSVNILGRWASHKSRIRKGVSGHRLLRDAWLLYGERCFEIVVLVLSDKERLKALENWWLLRNPAYNVFTEAHGKGRESPLKGKHHTKEVKEKLRQHHLGKGHTQDTKMKISRLNTGRKHSADTKRKIAEANARRVWTDESRAKMSASKRRAYVP